MKIRILLKFNFLSTAGLLTKIESFVEMVRGKEKKLAMESKDFQSLKTVYSHNMYNSTIQY